MPARHPPCGDAAPRQGHLAHGRQCPMGFLDRLFGKNRSVKKQAAREATALDRARGQRIAGRETGQTADEQAGTRGRMEAELDAQRARRGQSVVAETPPCPHTTLVPRWDSVADMGKEDKVTSYQCEGCHGTFTAAEGRALRETEAARVQHELAT